MLELVILLGVALIIGLVVKALRDVARNPVRDQRQTADGCASPAYVYDGGGYVDSSADCSGSDAGGGCDGGGGGD